MMGRGPDLDPNLVLFEPISVVKLPWNVYSFKSLRFLVFNFKRYLFSSLFLILFIFRGTNAGL